jgi:hypothetical protein
MQYDVSNRRGAAGAWPRGSQKTTAHVYWSGVGKSVYALPVQSHWVRRALS